MGVRNVRVEDAADIAEIYNYYIEKTTVTFETMEVSADEMSERLQQISANYPYLVYEDEGKVVGYCYAHQWKEKAAYQFTAEVTVYVAPQRRNGGIGRELMQHLLRECKAAGLHSLIACITVPNDESVRFHQNFGFRQASYFHQVGRKFGEWIDIYDFELTLD